MTRAGVPLRDRWRELRAPLGVGLLVLAVVLALTLLAAPAPDVALDPRSPGPSGTRAVARLLEAQGVRVQLAQRTDEAVAASGSGSTLLVARPDLLAPPQLARLAGTASDLVLLEPDDATLAELAPGVRRGAAPAPVRTRSPGCPLPVAVRAGPARTGGLTYRAVGSGPADECYPAAGGASLVVRRTDARTVTVLGSATLLTNEALATEGDAALALGLLGGQPRLVWYLPSAADLPAGAGGQSLLSLLPAGVRFALLQLAVAVVLLAGWRARRLGPVVTEPLPVAVRAAETVVGRARLYQRARARDRAAAELRGAAASRLRARLGLPAHAAPAALVASVAGHTGRSPAEVGELLYGASPADELALVRLADALDAVEREVRRP